MGYAVGGSGTLFKTEDNGTTWRRDRCPLAFPTTMHLQHCICYTRIAWGRATCTMHNCKACSRPCCRAAHQFNRILLRSAGILVGKGTMSRVHTVHACRLLGHHRLR